MCSPRRIGLDPGELAPTAPTTRTSRRPRSREPAEVCGCEHVPNQEAHRGLTTSGARRRIR